ncbi:MAG: response regulator transcription factor [Tannerellaceae bacterium]|jgi:DNA-binding LytR/AlgR family response regulator|nr:response regulator transcription factor [Tannerellaceae bacterium]MBP7487435.1 response regulator transcription factor [Parabacteroides sp.]MBP8759517.1 response regulator transcription factor [Parabacteroides sp.]MDD2416057.1 LytTR family DNA-binding domain-containing protein [Parabacteroides sp.]MDD3357733.1 LytTR family DNA-binding domain-containing protein [Parabacteroides sp.]
MKISCIVVDDEPLALEVLSSFIARIPYLVLEGQYTDPFFAMEHLRKKKVDLLFVDIQMPDISGIELVKTLNNPPKIVFTTAYSSYAIEGFNLNAMDYLLKPIAFDRFLVAVNKVRDYMELSEAAQEVHQPEEKDVPEYMFVKSNYKDIKINFNEVLYIEGSEDYIKIHTTTKKVMTLLSMKGVMEKLPENQFIRIHRSFIVAIDKIESKSNERITIGKQSLPIGASYLNEVSKRLYR